MTAVSVYQHASAQPPKCIMINIQLTNIHNINKTKHYGQWLAIIRKASSPVVHFRFVYTNASVQPPKCIMGDEPINRSCEYAG